MEKIGQMANIIRTWGSPKTYTLSPLAGGCLIAFVGLIFIATGACIQWDTLRFLPGTVSTTGTIAYCDMVENPSSHGTDCYPRVSFQTQAGQQIIFESNVGSNGYYEGEGVTVKYHPNNPQDARLDPGISWMFFISFGSFFVLCSLFSCLQGLINRIRGKVS